MNRIAIVSYIGKILLSVICIIACFFRSKLFKFNSDFAQFMVSIIAFCVLLRSLLCIYKSIGGIAIELEKAPTTLRSVSAGNEFSKTYSVDHIVDLLKKNDIIKICICVNESVVVVGVSAEDKPGRNDLFNKEYYMNDHCIGIDEIYRELMLLADSNGMVVVTLIDDVLPL